VAKSANTSGPPSGPPADPKSGDNADRLGIYEGFGDSLGSSGEGLVGASRGNRRPSMNEGQALGALPFTLKGKR